MIKVKLGKSDLFDLIDMCYAKRSENEKAFLDCMETIATIILKAVRHARGARERGEAIMFGCSERGR